MHHNSYPRGGTLRREIREACESTNHTVKLPVINSLHTFITRYSSSSDALSRESLGSLFSTGSKRRRMKNYLNCQPTGVRQFSIRSRRRRILSWKKGKEEAWSSTPLKIGANTRDIAQIIGESIGKALLCHRSWFKKMPAEMGIN